MQHPIAGSEPSGGTGRRHRFRLPLVRPVSVAVSLAVVLLVGLVPSSSARYDPWQRADLDLATAAFPTAAQPRVVDHDVKVGGTYGGSPNVDTAAAANVDCDGCVGDALSIQVMNLRQARSPVVDNFAAAWAVGCKDCEAVSFSLQVIVLDAVRTVTANNRALAVNAACESCGSAAAAYQIVIATRNGQLSSLARQQLRGWANQQAEALRAQAAGGGGMGIQSLEEPHTDKALDELETLVGNSMRGVLVDASADVDLG
jgi:hypothetical protein